MHQRVGEFPSCGPRVSGSPGGTFRCVYCPDGMIETQAEHCDLTSRNVPEPPIRVFHEYPTASGIYGPEHGAEKHTVAIVIREGSGFLICKGSHKLKNL